jgi:hypothetical protein
MTVALGLAACGSSTGSGKTEPPQLGAIPAKLKKRCADPVLVPDPPAGKDKLPEGQVRDLWGKDRKSLILCRDKDAGLVKFIEDRDRRIGGDK